MKKKGYWHDFFPFRNIPLLRITFAFLFNPLIRSKSHGEKYGVSAPEDPPAFPGISSFLSSIFSHIRFSQADGHV
jgi:hypothetical protein